MNATTIVAAGRGISRAVRQGPDQWMVEPLLADRDVRCLAADPLNPNVLYAGTQGQGLFRSDDCGASWRPAGLSGETVKSLAVSRAEPGTVFAGMKPAAVFASRDGGATWAECEGFRRVRARWWFSPAEPPFTAYVQAVVLSPTDPGVVIAGVELGAVVRSADGGRTWQGHRKGALRDCHSLAYHASDGRYVYEGGGTGGGASISRDAGATWTKPKAFGRQSYGWASAADPADPETWYIAASPGPGNAHSDGNAQAAIFRCRGGAWQMLAGGLPQPLDHMPYALVTDPGAPGHLYAGLSNGDVWFSADHGDAWQRLPLNLGRIQQMVIL